MTVLPFILDVGRGEDCGGGGVMAKKSKLKALLEKGSSETSASQTMITTGLGLSTACVDCEQGGSRVTQPNSAAGADHKTDSPDLYNLLTGTKDVDGRHWAHY